MLLSTSKYEIGNAFWKERFLQETVGRDEFRELFALLRTIFLKTKILAVEDQDLPVVAAVAETERITFYDASYATIAKAHSLTLVTEDIRLAKAASKHVKITKRRMSFDQL
jgi:predicted nucleic acid-binding protein